MQDGEKTPGPPRDGRSELARYSTLGISWACTVVLFTWCGVALDRRLETTPLFLLAGLVLGIGGGFYSLYTRLVADPEDSKDAEEKRGS